MLPAEQHLSFYSARGDPDTQAALSGETIDYSPTLTAPGTNVRSLRDPTGRRPGRGPHRRAQRDRSTARRRGFDAFYMPLTGTSMAAPALTGAVAVVQSAARARLGRLLTPAEVEQVVTGSAQPMTGIDGLWDFPCPDLIECGSADPNQGFTGQPYARWQVGAGYLDVAAAVDAVQAMPVPDAPGPAPGSPAEPGQVCADRLAPRARLGRARIRSTRRRLVLTGTATDRGCGTVGSGAIRGVRVAVARGVGRGQCRFAGRRGRLGSRRSCRRRRYLSARGTAAWSMALPNLPPGRYLAWARATDGVGNIGPLEGPRRLRMRRSR